MNNRKNYNSIVFLAAFFGLVLVGATPHVLAQTSQSVNQSEKLIAQTESGSTSLEKVMFELGKLISKDSTPTHLSVNWIASKNDVTNLQTLIAKGDSQVIEFLRKNFVFPNVQFYKSLDDLPVKELLQETKINPSEIVFETRATFSNSKNAKSFSESSELLFNELRKSEAKKEHAVSLFDDTKIRHKNNQVFIVTRLPRASIDELLAQNAR
jgi:hypothetical protein